MYRYINTYMCIHVFVYVCRYVFCQSEKLSHVHVYVCIFTLMCIYIHIHNHVHVCVYRYIFCESEKQRFQPLVKPAHFSADRREILWKRCLRWSEDRRLWIQVHTARHCKKLQDTATHFSARQHASKHCNTLQHTAALGNTLRDTAIHCNTLQHTATHYNTLQHTASHCNARCYGRYVTLQHTATHCTTLQHTTPHCNILHHTATHCNTPQHTATHCNAKCYERAVLDGQKTATCGHMYTCLLQFVAVCCIVLQCVVHTFPPTHTRTHAQIHTHTRTHTHTHTYTHKAQHHRNLERISHADRSYWCVCHPALTYSYISYSYVRHAVAYIWISHVWLMAYIWISQSWLIWISQSWLIWTSHRWLRYEYVTYDLWAHHLASLEQISCADMTDSYVRHAAVIRAPWLMPSNMERLIQEYRMAHLLSNLEWIIRTCAMTHAHVCHDPFICDRDGLRT